MLQDKHIQSVWKLTVAAIWICAAIVFCSAAQAEVNIYPPVDLPASSYYEVEVFDGTGWVDSYVNIDHARTAGSGSGDEAGKTFSWTTFETSDPVKVRVTRKAGGFNNVTIRPLRYGITATPISSNTVEFTLEPGQKVAVDFDSEVKPQCYTGTYGIPCIKNIMTVFADKKKTTSVLKGIDPDDIFTVAIGSHETLRPVEGLAGATAGQCTLNDADGKKVVYFGPGVYDIGYWQVPNNIEHIHIEAGAVVFGAIDVIPQGREPFYDSLETARAIYQGGGHSETLRKSFKLTGSGILSGAKLPWHLRKDFSYTSNDDWAVHVKGLQLAVENITLEDITIANAPHWVITLINDYDSRSKGIMDNFKLVGAWTYNNDGTPNLSGPDSVLRNAFIHADDDAFKIYNSGSRIENCVVWQSNNGAVFQFGWFPKSTQNVTVSDIDVIHFENWYGVNQTNRAVFNYANSSGNGTISNITFNTINIEGNVLRLFGFKCGQQTIRDITFTNLTCGGMGVGQLGGPGANYFSGNISNWTFNNFMFDGGPVASGAMAQFEFSDGAGQGFQFNSSLAFYLIDQPARAVVPEGSSAKFTVSTYSKDKPVTYQWYKTDDKENIPLANNTKFSGVKTNTLTVTDCQNADEAKFFCIVSSPDEEPLTSETAPLVVTSVVGGDLADGLLGYWPGEDSMQDMSGNGRDGTKIGNGAMNYDAGKVGSAFLLDGASAIDTGTWDPDQTGEMTLAFWCYVTGDEYDGVIAKNGQNGKEFALEVKSGSQQLEFSGQDYLQQKGNITLNNWYHVVITVNTDTKIAQMWINGQLNQTQDNFDLGDCETAPLIIGSKTPNAQFMAGKMDEVAVWERVLSPDNIALLYNNGQGNPITADTKKAHNSEPPISATVSIDLK